MLSSLSGRCVRMKTGENSSMRVIALIGGLALTAGLAPMALADSYSAQPRQEVVSVDRIPQEYQPTGMRFGAFDLFPMLDLSEAYSDNIYRTQTDTRDDLVSTVSPSVRLQSDWSRHELGVQASAAMVNYLAHSAENHNNLNIAADGRVDIMHDMNAYAGASYHQLYEDRGTPTDQNGTHPQKYNLASGNAGFFNQFNRLSVRLDGKVDQYTYADLTTTTGIIRENDRDHADAQGTVRVGYEVLTGWEPFVRYNYVDSDYRTAKDRNGVNKDNNGYEVDVGTAFNLNGIWAGEAFAGYLTRDFDDRQLSSVSKPTFGLALVANVTPLTSIKSSINRTVDPSITLGSSSLTDTTYGISADTEMLRNFVVSAGGNYTQTDYNGISRTDDVTTVGTKAKYYLNHYFSVGPEISYVTRDAQNSGGQDDYNNWIFLLRLTGRI
jgi:hypothetical protein